MKNVLILNAGTRDKLLMYFKRELAGKAKLIATDSYNLAPAIYEADKYYILPRWDDPGYWDKIYNICRNDHIGLIISLIDPELEMLAKQKETFASMNILVNISDVQTVRKSFDKLEMNRFLKEHHYPYIKTYSNFVEVLDALSRKEICFPLFVKPRFGSGSIGIEKVNSQERLLHLCQENSDLLIQEYIDGTEFGVDVFVDLISNTIVSLFAKKKVKMRAGETDKSCSYKNPKLFQLIEQFAMDFKLQGVNDIDVFESNGDFYISEVNPRFGGGYLHAYECGENYPHYLINNMNGIENKRNIGHYKENIYMMKYFDIKILEMDD